MIFYLVTRRGSGVQPAPRLPPRMSFSVSAERAAGDLVVSN